MVEVTGLEPAASCSQTNLYRFFSWFTRLFGAFVSEIGAFGCSCQHCFHVVRICRWSKLWSSPFRWDQNAIRKSKIRLLVNSFSAVMIPYTKPYANIANNATTDQSGWMTAAFFSSAWWKPQTTHEEQVFMIQDVAAFYQNIRLSCCKMKESMI